MDKSLFKIEQEYLVIAQKLIENDGEITEELNESLKINQKDLQTKSINYGFVIKQYEFDCDIIDAEINRLKKLKEVREKAVERLKQSVSWAMDLYEIDKIETPLMKISFRSSESVEVLDLSVLDRKYVSIKTVETPDKNLIKESIKSGSYVLGAVLKQNKNLQIK